MATMAAETPAGDIGTVPAPSVAGGTYALTLLFVANALNYADRSLLGIVVEPIRAELGLNDTQISLLSGFAFVLFNLVAGVMIARRVDRGNRRLILAGGVALWSLATAATGLGHGFFSLAICRVLVGAGEAVIFPVGLSLLADFYGGARMPRAAGIFQAGSGVGVVIGSVAAGMLAAAHGWRMMFVICGLAGLALVLLIATTLREPARVHHPDGGKGESLWATLAALVRIPGMTFLTLGYGVANMMLAVLPTWAPAFLLRSHGVKLAEVGGVIGPAAVIGGISGTVIAGIAATRMVARTGNRVAGLAVPVWMLPVAVPGFALFLFAPSIPLLMVGIAMINFFLASALGPCVALAVQSVAPDRRALTSTVMLIVQSVLGFGLAPLIVGAVSDSLAPTLGEESLKYALTLMLAAPIVASFFLWLARRRIPA